MSAGQNLRMYFVETEPKMIPHFNNSTRRTSYSIIDYFFLDNGEISPKADH